MHNTFKNVFLVLHGMLFHMSGYGWWRCEWVTSDTVVYTYILGEAYNKGLFSHQMLLIYQRMFLSMKSSLLEKHMLQLLDSQESNVQLMSLKLRTQPDYVKNLPQFAILLAFQG